ncbi:hypothetical protein Clacol_007678 [Clathrus columnatus]|uniref:Uncharacterized protein n=1 Tax=Clathrus columnatus TaxID=1419009 RepID=A0AAV5AFK3_9AGAM|nr:hypothetical protein Clacol_007678 [Clathrus columnatus]
MLHECDGMICASSTAFEPVTSRAVKEWFAKTNRSLYVVGPLLPDSVLLGASEAVEPTPETNDKEVLAFLDSIYATSGPHSLIYVSFGSIFWPSGNGIWRVVEIILNRDIPLILAYDEERLGKMPEHIAERFKASNKTLTSIWAPQQTILRHPATGWLLTQCGQNSITEAIVQGVPMIAWPLSAEQPGNAAYITLVLGIAYEIVEGRSGPGLKPMYRGIQPQGTLEALEKEAHGILDKAFGDDGKKKRENIRVLRDKVRAGLVEGGDSFVDFARLVRDYIRV